MEGLPMTTQTSVAAAVAVHPPADDTPTAAGFIASPGVQHVQAEAA